MSSEAKLRWWRRGKGNWRLSPVIRKVQQWFSAPPSTIKQPPTMPLIYAIGVGLLLWKILCVILRHRRSKLIHSLDPIHDALALQKIANFVEFPFLADNAVEFVNIRAFAIPSISKILQSTGQFRKAVVKRHDDTVILIQELLVNHVDSARGNLAIRRLNFLHSRFRISNADFLYVLSTFILEPPRFAAKYGFRKWTEKEMTANFVIWRDIGTRMGMSDIPETLEEMERFNRQHEAQNMVYCDSNRDCADPTLALLLSKMPSCFRPVGRRIIFALFDERLLKALGYPQQPAWLVWGVHRIVRLLAGNFVGWFLPPRPLHWSAERIPKDAIGGNTMEERVYTLRYNPYEPASYSNGYQISQLGDAPAGLLGSAVNGNLMCPLHLSDRKKAR